MLSLPKEHYKCKDCQAEWFADSDKKCIECNSKNIVRIK